MILSHPLHTFKSDDQFVGASIEGDTLVIANTRNEEHAQEGQYLNLVTVIPLQEAIKMAKAILATQRQVDEDAMIDAMWERQLDRQAMEDDALSHDVIFMDSFERYGIERSNQ